MEKIAFKFTSLLFWPALALATLILTPISIILGFFDWRGIWSHRLNCIWARIVMILTRAQIQIIGSEHVDSKKTYVIAGNHESQADIPLMMSALPIPFKFAAKRSLFYIPALGWSMMAARYVAIDRGAGVEKAKLALKNLTQCVTSGSSVLMFPEGTRTRDGKLRPFKSGAFRLALQCKVDILPVAIFGSRRGLAADDWVVKPTTVIVNIGRPISVHELANTEDGGRILSDRCRERIIALYQEAKEADEKWQSLSVPVDQPVRENP